MERHDDGSVTLARHEVDRLVRDVDRWVRACDQPDSRAAGLAVVDLACDVRAILEDI